MHYFIYILQQSQGELSQQSTATRAENDQLLRFVVESAMKALEKKNQDEQQQLQDEDDQGEQQDEGDIKQKSGVKT